MDILAFFTKLWQEIVHTVVWVMSWLWNLMQTFVYFVWDMLCSMIEWVFANINFGADAILSALNWSAMPTQAAYILGQLWIPKAIALISGALIVRIILNLIPGFITRL